MGVPCVLVSYRGLYGCALCVGVVPGVVWVCPVCWCSTRGCIGVPCVLESYWGLYGCALCVDVVPGVV